MANIAPRQAAALTLARARQLNGHLKRPGFQERRLTLLLERLSSRSQELGRPLRVLDLACGDGLLTCAAALLGHRSLGLDSGAEAIHQAKLFAQELGCDGIFWRSDLLLDPFWEQTVGETLGGKPDVVTLTDTLRELPQVEFFVERLSRWMEPSTQLLVAERNPRAFLRRFDGRSYADWRQILEGRGFEVEQPRGVDDFEWLERLSPTRCSSLVFTSRRR